MIKLVESQTVEFKQIWKYEHLKIICTFANTDGRELFIGICDDKEVVGAKRVKIIWHWVLTLPYISKRDNFSICIFKNILSMKKEKILWVR